MQDFEILRQNFREKLSLIVKNLQSDISVFPETVTITPLATLTKLIFRRRECLRAVVLDRPIIVSVLAGTKTIYLDEQEYIFKAGELFFLPSAIAIDVINQPDLNSGEYIALVLELSSNLIERIRLAYPEVVDETHSNNFQSKNIRLDIPLSPDLAETFIHLVKNVVDNVQEADISYLNEHHIIEVILRLLRSDLREQILQVVYPDFLTYICHILHRDLSFSWSATKLAEELGISVSTLKRRLKAKNVSFKQILLQERMNKAMRLLKQDRYAIAEIAIACGYESPSRFATRFFNERTYFGKS